MRRQSLVALIVLALVVPLAAQKDNNSQRIPAVIATARYVYVTTADGDIDKPDVSPQDRKAAAALREYLQEWGRYKVANRAEDAEIIAAVSSGRVADVKGGASTRGTTTVGASLTSPADTLLIYDARQGTDSSALWRRSQIDGFVGGAPLFDVFKRDVEAAAKRTSSKEAKQN